MPSSSATATAPRNLQPRSPAVGAPMRGAATRRTLCRWVWQSRSICNVELAVTPLSMSQNNRFFLLMTKSRIVRSAALLLAISSPNLASCSTGSQRLCPRHSPRRLFEVRRFKALEPKAEVLCSQYRIFTGVDFLRMTKTLRSNTATLPSSSSSSSSSSSADRPSMYFRKSTSLGTDSFFDFSSNHIMTS